VHVSTDQTALRDLLAGEPITYYCGFDPTAPSLHLGNLVQLLLMRRLQLAGHRPLGLVGGSTGLIGDPRPTAERTLNTKDTVAEWVGNLRAQVERYLSFEGDNAARMVNNLDWTAPMSAIDFLREIGKYYRVGTMLKKDAVAARLNSEAASATPSSATRSCRGWTTSSCIASTAACCRPAGPTSGATSPAAPTSSTASKVSRCTRSARP
jgi:tyrosyl-tRNA synthetase